MKKRIIASVLIAGLGFGGWYVWQENRVYIEMAREVMQSRDEKTENNSQIEESMEPTTTQGGPEVIKSEPVQTPQGQNNTGAKDQANSGLKPEEPSNIANDQEAALVKAYREKFLALKNEYQEKINTLLTQAKEEYLAVPEDKRGTAKFTLGLKYLKKGKALEDECDDKFEALLAQMKKELQTNGFTPDEVKIAQERYEVEKLERQRTLMEKMLNKD